MEAVESIDVGQVVNIVHIYSLHNGKVIKLPKVIFLIIKGGERRVKSLTDIKVN